MTIAGNGNGATGGALIIFAAAIPTSLRPGNTQCWSIPIFNGVSNEIGYITIFVNGDVKFGALGVGMPGNNFSATTGVVYQQGSFTWLAGV